MNIYIVNSNVNDNDTTDTNNKTIDTNNDTSNKLIYTILFSVYKII